MKHTKRLLQSITWTGLAICALIIFLCEMQIVLPGVWADWLVGQFWALTLMEIITLVAIPFALYLFRTKWVTSAQSSSLQKELRQWAVVRLLLLILPLVGSVIGYYLFLSVTFTYLALLLLCSLVFVFPTTHRCEAEGIE